MCQACRTGYEIAAGRHGETRNRRKSTQRAFPSWRRFESAEYATLEWVDWFNKCRPLETIGNIPPEEAEGNFYAALETESVPRN
jgi:transposase InsO family protein